MFYTINIVKYNINYSKIYFILYKNFILDD